MFVTMEVLRLSMTMSATVVVRAVRARVRCVGAALGFKRRVLLGHDQVLLAQHVGQHVVRFEL
jgi:hypothetical protein